MCECQCEYKTIQVNGHTQLINGGTNSCKKCVNKKYNTYNLSGEYGIGYLCDGYEFYFDLEDYDKIKKHCWHKHKDGYLRSKIDGTYYLQHRLIMDCNNKEIEIDHINRKRYDNRKSNMILVTHNENMKNYGKYKSNTSGIIGVCYCERELSWKSYIQFNKEKIHIGTYFNKDDAIIARLKKEKQLYSTITKKPPQLHLFKQYGVDND